jgi:hypothetical protein
LGLASGFVFLESFCGNEKQSLASGTALLDLFVSGRPKAAGRQCLMNF